MLQALTLIFIRKKIAIFLIGLLGFNASGVSLFLCFEIALCKIRAKDNDNIRIEKSRALAFSSHTGGLKLIGDDELMVSGKMYDIVEQKIINGVTIYYAASDDIEDGILTKISISNQSNTSDKSFASTKLKIYKPIYCLLKLKRKRVPIFSKIMQVKTLDSPASYRLYFSTIVLPPPQYNLV